MALARAPVRLGRVMARSLSSAHHPPANPDVEPEPHREPDPWFKLRAREFIPLSTRKEMLAAMDEVPYDHQEAYQYYLKHLKKPEEIPAEGTKEFYVYRAMIHTAKNHADTWTMPLILAIPSCLFLFYKY